MGWWHAAWLRIIQPARARRTELGWTTAIAAACLSLLAAAPGARASTVELTMGENGHEVLFVEAAAAEANGILIEKLGSDQMDAYRVGDGFNQLDTIHITPGAGCAAEPGSASVICSPNGEIEIDVRLGDEDDEFLLLPGADTGANRTLSVYADLGAGDDRFMRYFPFNTLVPDAEYTVFGGEGSDAVTTGKLGDVVVGESGNDGLDSGFGDDLVDGGAGDDSLQSGPGNDALDGWEGEDVLDANEGDDALDGGQGEDVLRGFEGDDVLDGGAGNDTVWDGSGDDDVTGGPGDDSLGGSSGSDFVDAGSGDDLLFAGEAGGGLFSDVFVGGDGNDTVDYTAHAGSVEVSLDGLDNDGYVSEHDLVGPDGDVENIIGPSLGENVLIGDSGPNRLTGGSGYTDPDFVTVNWLFGEEGPDVLLGHAGEDIAEGGPGEDRFTLGEGADLAGADDGARDEIDCGADEDEAYVDLIDELTGCEYLYGPPVIEAADEIADIRPSGAPQPTAANLSRASLAAPRRLRTVLVSRRGLLALTGVAASCPAGGSACSGIASVRTTAAVYPARRKRRLLLAKGRFSVAAGSTTGVKVRLTRTGRRTLQRYGRLTAVVKLTLTDAAGGSVTKTLRVRLRMRRG